MKTFLRVVLAFLILLLVIFLGAGLLIPEVTYTTEVKVSGQLDSVWDKFNDPSTIQEWIPEVVNMEVINEEPGVTGSRYKMTVENNGQKMIMTETVTDYRDRERVALKFEGGEMIKNDAYTFAEAGGQIQIAGEHVCRGKGYIHRCMFAFFRKMFKSIDQTSLDQFKDWYESEQQ